MPTPMPDAVFWEIIDRVARTPGAPEDRLEALATALTALSLDDVIAFEMTFRRLLNKAYTWDLWGAAYVIHGGCSDDGFEYFRRWLVSRGRAAYEAALADADRLADLDLEPTGPEGYWEFSTTLRATSLPRRAATAMCAIIPRAKRASAGRGQRAKSSATTRRT